MIKRQISGFIILIAMIMGMSSCNQQTIVQGDQWKIESMYILDWQYTRDTEPTREQFSNNYYYAYFDWPSLTSTVFKEGNVQAYLVRTSSDGTTKMKSPLPYVQSKELFDSQGQTIFYTETYDFVYGTGWIEFQWRISNFMYEDYDGKDATFKPQPSQMEVVLTW